MIDSNTSNNKRESPTIENKCGQTATSDFLVQWEMIFKYSGNCSIKSITSFKTHSLWFLDNDASSSKTLWTNSSSMWRK